VEEQAMKTTKAIFAAVSLIFASGPLAAADYPTKPVELVNSANPGGGSDIFLRMLASVSAEPFGGDFVVVSKPGGRSIVAMNYVNGRPRDGYTLEIFTPGQLQQIAEGKGPFKYDDIEPVVVGTIDPVVLVAKKGKFKDIQDAIAQGKTRRLRIGGTETGNFEWLAAMSFANESKIQRPIYVPLGGGGDVILNTIGATLEIGVGNLTEVTAQVKAGELDALMVMAEKRSPSLPNTPTAREVGMDLVLAQSRGLVALKGTPLDRIQKLEQAFLKGMQSPKYQEYLTSNGLGSDSIGDRAKWGKIMKETTARVMKSFADLKAAQKEQKQQKK
jgi:tripartite-type tricarboxylate transporter receptor subunit TctC